MTTTERGLNVPGMKGKTTYVHFDSVRDTLEFKSYCQGAADEVERRDATMRPKDYVSWFGIAGGAPAVRDALEHGWKEGRTLVSDLPTLDLPPVKSIRRRKVWSDHGSSVDMHRVYAGDLDHAWQRTRREASATTPRVATIIMDISAHAGQGAPDLVWRGAAALVLSDALTNAGLSVRIIGVHSSSGNQQMGLKHNSIQSVQVKDVEQPLDLDSLAAVVALTGYVRSYLHPLCGPSDGRPHDSGMGGSYEADKAVTFVASRFDDGGLMLTMPGGSCDNRDGAVRWLKAMTKVITSAIG